MLKPIYLPTLVICLLYIIGRYVFIRTERKTLIWGFLGIILSIGSILGYCEMNYKKYGEFTLSKIKLNNTLANIVISKAYLFGQDEELITVVEEMVYYNLYPIVFTLNNEFVDKYKDAYKKFPKNLEPSQNAEGILKLPDSYNYSETKLNAFVKHSSLSKNYIYYIIKSIIKIFFHFYIVTMVVIFELLRLIWVYFKFKQYLWVQFFCTLTIISFFFVIAIGGINDWDRLIIPSVPAIFVTFVIFLDFICSGSTDFTSKSSLSVDEMNHNSPKIVQ
jgi:hypothetical protein